MRALVLAGLAALAAPVAAQPAPTLSAPAAPALDASTFRVYRGDGRAATLDDVLAAMDTADAVFLGEEHDDEVAHALQRWLLHQAHTRPDLGRPVVLALEMIERDAQLVLDEYLGGLAREQDFLAASRLWANYQTDYRPLVEYARANTLRVVASNVPTRYASLVARDGEAALGRLLPEARAFLPRPPVAPPSDALAAKFRAQMAATPHSHGAPADSAHGSTMPSMDGLLAAQNLRDATMAESVARALAMRRYALVLHVNGRFHSEGGLGIPEHLARLRPGVRTLVVTMRKAERLGAPPAPSPGDDFVILTRTGG